MPANDYPIIAQYVRMSRAVSPRRLSSITPRIHMNEARHWLSNTDADQIVEASGPQFLARQVAEKRML